MRKIVNRVGILLLVFLAFEMLIPLKIYAQELTNDKVNVAVWDRKDIVLTIL